MSIKGSRRNGQERKYPCLLEHKQHGAVGLWVNDRQFVVINKGRDRAFGGRRMESPDVGTLITLAPEITGDRLVRTHGVWVPVDPDEQFVLQQIQ